MKNIDARIPKILIPMLKRRFPVITQSEIVAAEGYEIVTNKDGKLTVQKKNTRVA